MPNNPSNHLIGEKSPYLLAHAHNPVDWYPWGKEAFDKAKLEDKPILLSVGYSTCHWCHVMAHESFEDIEISSLINEHFIAIKVDREERPDIDHIYMSATTSLTGQGGWPLTVFLTPQGDPFYGGTYFPPYAKWGSIGFIDLLNSISKAWQSDRDNIVSSSVFITESLQRKVKEASSAELIDESLLDKAYRQLRGQFDEANGGFGSAPKFPMGHNLSFLLRYFKKNDDHEALEMVKASLTAMANGGIWDHLGGGFHRYSTDQRWHVPHFEKMLYDQALLSRAYLEGYQVTGSIEYSQVARDILNYVAREMTDELGGFYSAQDADSAEAGHLKEGAYYVFSQTEIEEALDKHDIKVFNYCYGVLPEGNAAFDPHGEFKGKNILYRAHTIEEAAAEFFKHEYEIQDILKASATRLLAKRKQRPHPYQDDKILCDWNGLMISSFAFAGRVLAEKRYTHIALKAADFILAHMMDKRRLWHRWRDGNAAITATLEDYSFFIYGLLEVYEATFQDKYLDAAKELTDGMIDLFADETGGFFMTATDAEKLILRPKEVYDGAVPSGNSVAALVLLRLYALTKKDVYMSQAEKLFSCFASSVTQAPYAHCFLLSALVWHVKGPLEITFEGTANDPKITKMLLVLYEYFIPFKTVMFKQANKNALAHICYRGTCKLPVDNVEAFETELFKRY